MKRSCISEIISRQTDTWTIKQNVIAYSLLIKELTHRFDPKLSMHPALTWALGSRVETGLGHPGHQGPGQAVLTDFINFKYLGVTWILQWHVLIIVCGADQSD